MVCSSTSYKCTFTTNIHSRINHFLQLFWNILLSSLYLFLHHLVAKTSLLTQGNDHDELWWEELEYQRGINYYLYIKSFSCWLFLSVWHLTDVPGTESAGNTAVYTSQHDPQPAVDTRLSAGLQPDQPCSNWFPRWGEIFRSVAVLAATRGTQLLLVIKGRGCWRDFIMNNHYDWSS